VEDGGPRRCAQGDWCREREIVNGEILAAETPRSFCGSCSGEIGRNLADLPYGWDRAHREIAQLSRGGRAVRVPFGPRLPGSRLGEVDAVLREITECLLGWDERVRAVARMSHVSRTRGLHAGTAKAVGDAARLLGDNLGVLLALDENDPGSEMRRFERGEPELRQLGGTAAGLEILSAHRHALRVLGELRPQTETFDGVPCKHCEDMGSLERAEPPSDPSREAMWSRCASCLDTMSKKDFDAWVKWYSGWADKAGLTCRRCVLDHHDECDYDECRCLTCAKVAA
jgi:hypothetical protein